MIGVGVVKFFLYLTLTYLFFLAIEEIHNSLKK